MKLMVVGIQGIGKTSLLDRLRQESAPAHRRKPPEVQIKDKYISIRFRIF